jgi:heat shock protein HslJ
LNTQTGEIGEFVKDFEGEADPSRMTLGMKKWFWISTERADGGKVLPKSGNAFSLTFNADGSVAVGTDCNSMGGQYTTAGNTLSFGALFSTMMYCEGSQEQEYSSTLAEVAKYRFTSRGELILELKGEKGMMLFR